MMIDFAGYFESEEDLLAAVLEYDSDSQADLDDLLEYVEDMGAILMHVSQVEESFHEVLDCEGPLMIGTLEYWPSEVLKEVDPIAYRCGLADYADSLSEDHVVYDF